MLQPPNLPDEKLVACLHADYGLQVAGITFLPLGADVNTAVYRVAAAVKSYFLKLRQGEFNEIAVLIPHLLHDQGVTQVIAPIATHVGGLWTRVDGFTATLYPFVEGRSGFEAPLSDRHCVELSAALKGLHTAVLPPALVARIPRESFAPYWRDMVTTFQAQVEETVFEEPVASKTAAFMRSRREQIADLVQRADELGRALEMQHLDLVLCHADIHAGNVLLGDDGALYIVDWDTLILAPKERDLMFVGAGLGIGDTSEQEALFYRGYGETEIDTEALAYYRYERIVEDIAAFCQQLLLTREGGADRERSFGYLRGQFQPDDVVERAYRLGRGLRG